MSQNNQATITFHGGAGIVTGSNFLLEVFGKKIIIDCGLVQGDREAAEKNYADFNYDPKTIDYVIITHAHIDHIGRLPRLVAQGFSGPIYCTEPTADLMELMLDDSQRVLADHAKDDDRDPLYSPEDVARTLALVKPISYHYELAISDNIHATLYEAGHVLGSAQVVFRLGSETRVLFTGDLGNSPSPLLRDTEIPPGPIHYMLTESVYGDRNHEDREERFRLLERAIEDTLERKGTLLIPVFSLERTQEVLFAINDLVENQRLPHIPIFLDSPLAIKITEVYKQHLDLLNDEVQQARKKDNDIFSFPGLKVTESVRDSKTINDVPGPKIILAGSGMSMGGRILHHELHYLADKKNIILFVGYQGAGTTGRKIREGAKRLSIYGNEIRVAAEVRAISGFSGHKDSDHIQEYIAALAPSLKKVWCVMGEPKSANFLAQRLRDYLGLSADAPAAGEQVIIPLL